MKAVYASLVGMAIGVLGMLVFGMSNAGIVSGGVFIASMLTLWIASVVVAARKLFNYTPD